MLRLSPSMTTLLPMSPSPSDHRNGGGAAGKGDRSAAGGVRRAMAARSADSVHATAVGTGWPASAGRGLTLQTTRNPDIAHIVRAAVNLDCSAIAPFGRHPPQRHQTPRDPGSDNSRRLLKSHAAEAGSRAQPRNPVTSECAPVCAPDKSCRSATKSVISGPDAGAAPAPREFGAPVAKVDHRQTRTDVQRVGARQPRPPAGLDAADDGLAKSIRRQLVDTVDRRWPSHSDGWRPVRAGTACVPSKGTGPRPEPSAHRT